MLELALLQEGHKPFEGDNAEDKRDDHTHQEFRGKATGIGALHGLFGVQESLFRSHGLALDPLDAIEECSTAHGRNAHEEAEFASVLAVHAHEHHGADGRAATADARDAGDALNDASHESAPPVHLDAFVFRVLGASRSPLRREKQNAREEFCNADGSRIHEQRFKGVLEAEANQCGRDGSKYDVACFAQLVAVATEATDDDVYDFLAEHHEN